MGLQLSGESRLLIGLCIGIMMPTLHLSGIEPTSNILLNNCLKHRSSGGSPWMMCSFVILSAPGDLSFF